MLAGFSPKVSKLSEVAGNLLEIELNRTILLKKAKVVGCPTDPPAPPGPDELTAYQVFDQLPQSKPTVEPAITF